MTGGEFYLYAVIELRCAAARKDDSAAEHARRSLGQQFRRLREQLERERQAMWPWAGLDD
jgi:hypothetical protein